MQKEELIKNNNKQEKLKETNLKIINLNNLIIIKKKDKRAIKYIKIYQ